MKNNIIIAVLFLGIFVFYLHHMAPTVTEGDSGEFITASVNLSIPHAPSYPLFTLIGKAVQTAVPWGNYGYRINLVSALTCAAGGAVMYVILFILGAGAAGSVTGALILAGSTHIFENALVTEVFGLHMLLVLLIMLIVIRSSSAGSYVSNRRGAYAAAYVSGLACANHQTILLMGPGLLVWFMVIHADMIRKRQYAPVVSDAVICAVLFAAGSSVYGFLTIRSLKNPFLDWSNPENVHNLWRVVSRADYGSFSLTLGEKMDSNIITFFKQSLRYCHALIDEFTVPGVILGLVGFYRWIIHSPGRKGHMGIVVSVLFFVSSFVFLHLANMPFNAEATGIMGRFYIMPSLFFGMGIGYVFVWMNAGRLRKALIVFMILPVYMLARNVPLYGRRMFFTSYDYGRNILKSMPPGAVLFIDGGDDTFYSLAYLTRAEMMRTDLRIHDRGGLIFPNPYGSDFRRIGKQNKPARREKVEAAVLETSRPLLYSTMNWNILKMAVLRQRGIIFRAFKESDSSTDRDLWPFYTYRDLYPSVLAPSIYRVRAIIPIYDYLRGVHAFNNGAEEKAFLYWKRGYLTGSDIDWFTGNVGHELIMRGYYRYKEGDLVLAEKCYRNAIELDPHADPAYVNLGVLLEKKGDVSAAESLYRQALTFRPDNVDALYNLSVIYWQREDWQKVVEQLRLVLEVEPEHKQALRYLQRALHKKNNPGG